MVTGTYAVTWVQKIDKVEFVILFFDTIWNDLGIDKKLMQSIQ